MKDNEYGSQSDINDELVKLEQVAEEQPVDIMDNARSERNKLQQYGNLVNAFQGMVQGMTGAKSLNSGNPLISQGKQVVDDVLLDRKEVISNKDQERKDKNMDMRQQLQDMQQEKHANFMLKFPEDLKLAKAQSEGAKIKVDDEKLLRDPNFSVIPMAVNDLEIHLNKNRKAAGQGPINLMEEFDGNKPNLAQLSVLKKFLDDGGSDLLDLRRTNSKLREASLALRDKKENRLAQNQGFKQKEKQEISDKQSEELFGYDSALESLDSVLEMKESVDTGLFANMTEAIKDYTGKGGIPFSNLRTELGENLLAKVKQLSGTAASDTERAVIATISLPSLKDDDNEFIAKIVNAKKILERAKKLRIENYKKQGKNPEAFESGKIDPGVVKMKAPNGEVVSVKAENVQKYLDKGAEIVK